MLASSVPEDSICFLLQVAAGTESVCRDECLESLGHIVANVCVLDPGLLLLVCTTTSHAVLGLRSVLRIIALAYHSMTLDTGPEAPQLTRDAALALVEGWTRAADLWRTLTASDGLPENPPVFRVTCDRSGTHQFKSDDMASALGHVVAVLFGWKVDLSHPDVEVYVFIRGRALFCGFNLASTSSGFLDERFRAVQGASAVTTRPSLCFVLARHAMLRDGLIVVDPFGGCGTIIAEAACSWRIFGLCGDVVGTAVEVAAAALPPNRGAALSWTATRLPLRSACVDRVISDMPFGMRCGSYRVNRKLYPEALAECSRVLVTGGLAVLMTMEKKLVLGSLSSLPTFAVRVVHELRVGGTRGHGGFAAWVFVLERLGPEMAAQQNETLRKNRAEREQLSRSKRQRQTDWLQRHQGQEQEQQQEQEQRQEQEQEQRQQQRVDDAPIS